jgi:Tfp pilus assembly protein PilO
MESVNVREEVKRLMDRLPSDTTWDDVMHEIYVRQAIESGLEDSRLGRVTDAKEVRRRYGLTK